jgi:hypothetical protein
MVAGVQRRSSWRRSRLNWRKELEESEEVAQLVLTSQVIDVSID